MQTPPPSQPQLYPISNRLLLISSPAEGRRLSWPEQWVHSRLASCQRFNETLWRWLDVIRRRWQCLTVSWRKCPFIDSVIAVSDLVTRCLRWRCHEMVRLWRPSRWWSLAITYSRLTSTSQLVLQQRRSSWVELRRQGTCRLTGWVWALTVLVRRSSHIATFSRPTSRFVAMTTVSSPISTVVW